MQLPTNSALAMYPEGAWQWRRAALSFLALSAAVNVDLLEERDEQGRHKFVRGRHKYYGVASLVIFFAIFSGYGMGHMLATMSTISVWGATIAGVIWAVFQWCLERQMLISIRLDASWWQKLFGLSWRSLLALLSASTMVYPFFVESNRAEIDVKVGEMARTRLVDNVQTAQLAVGLPVLHTDAKTVEGAIKQVDLLLASEPPDLAAYRQKARQCWTRFYDEEFKINRQLGTLQALRSSMPNDAALEAKVDALRQKLSQARVPCQGADSLVMNKLMEWKQQKNAEKKLLTTEQQTIIEKIKIARQKEALLTEEQEMKINHAAKSGFAADFAAVAELVRHDANRRFQLIWWLVWFLAIEMVAILVKFTSNTDLDQRLHSDEIWTNLQTQHQLNVRQDELAIAALQANMRHKAEQAFCLADEGKLRQERLSREQEIDQAIHEQLCQLDGRLRLSVESLKLRMQQLEVLEKISQQTRFSSNNHRVENLIQETIEQVLEPFSHARPI